MDEQLMQLVHQVRQHPFSSKQQEQALRNLTNYILELRLICRLPRDRSLPGVYRSILEELERQLYQEVARWCADLDAIPSPIASNLPWRDRPASESLAAIDWMAFLQGSLSNAYRQVLDGDRLEKLALEAQRYTTSSSEKRYAFKELFWALKLSGKLTVESTGFPDVYEEAVNRTLIWIYENLRTFDPARGSFLSWVNYRLSRFLQQVQRERQDPLVQATEARLIRTKYKLKSILRNIEEENIYFWLGILLRGWRGSSGASSNAFLALSVTLVLARFLEQYPREADALSFEMAVQLLSLPASIFPASFDPSMLENVPQTSEPPSLSELLRQYMEADPENLLQQSVRSHPELTFQAIALRRLDGETWQEIADTYGVGISTVSTFFQRRLKELAPQIRRYIQDRS